jgi:hypothetical protein
MNSSPAFTPPPPVHDELPLPGSNQDSPDPAPLPDIPIAALTSMRSDSAAWYVNGTARGYEVWRVLHDEWFRRSRNGIHIQTTRSGHDMQHEEPQLVIDVIRFVFDRVRGH